MKKTLVFILSIMCFTTLAIGSFSYLPDYLTKKMDRQLTKIFGSNIKHQELSINDSLTINHQVFKVLVDDTLRGYSMITRGLGCRIGGCDKPTNDSTAFEQFYFMTAFDSHKKIKRVRVLEYTANHGYQIAGKRWLKQFENGSDFKVGVNVDGISGATISVNSITNSVNKQLSIIQTVDSIQ